MYNPFSVFGTNDHKGAYTLTPLQAEIIHEFCYHSQITIIHSMAVLFVEGSYSTIGAKGAYDNFQKTGKGERLFLILSNITHEDDVLRVFFHEVAHATMRENRTARRQEGLRWSMHDKLYCEEEVVAETTALLLLNHFGLSTEYTNQKTAKYIEQYAQDLTAADLGKAKLDAIAAAQYILENWLPEFNRKVLETRTAV